MPISVSVHRINKVHADYRDQLNEGSTRNSSWVSIWVVDDTGLDVAEFTIFTNGNGELAKKIADAINTVCPEPAEPEVLF
jgi:hypothetical protein